MKIRETVKNFRKKARKVFNAGLLSAGLMLAGSNSIASENQGKVFSTRLMGGVYQTGKTPFVGLGTSGQLMLEGLRIDARLDTIFPEFKKAELDHAELGVTFPINQHFALTPFVYRSQYYGGVPLGAGVAFHLTQLNLHFAPHWIQGKNALPLPISWTPRIGEADLMFKIMIHTTHTVMPRPAPLIGGEIKASINISDAVKTYGKTFMMTVRDKDGKMTVGAVTVQGGFEWTF